MKAGLKTRGSACSVQSMLCSVYYIITVANAHNRGQVYFKNSEMREMDDHFGDLYGMISDREIEISHELAQFVLEYESMLTTASDVCGELDR